MAEKTNNKVTGNKEAQKKKNAGTTVPKGASKVVRQQNDTGGKSSKNPVKSVQHKSPTEGKHRQLKYADQRSPFRFIWISFILLFLAIFILISEISFFSNWKTDADIVGLSLFSHIESIPSNSCGHVGAIVSDLFIRQLFGVSGILVPLILVFFSVSTAYTRKKGFRKWICNTLALMCFISLFLGHFPGRDVSVFGSGLGGEMGIYIAEWISKYLGFEGTSVLLVISLVAIIWMIFSDEVLWIYRQIEKICSVLFKPRTKIAYDQTAGNIPDIHTASETESEDAVTSPVATDIPPFVPADTTGFIPVASKTAIAEAIPLDNGQTGALVWSDRILFLRTDLIQSHSVIINPEEKIETAEDTSASGESEQSETNPEEIFIIKKNDVPAENNSEDDTVSESGNDNIEELKTEPSDEESSLPDDGSENEANNQKDTDKEPADKGGEPAKGANNAEAGFSIEKPEDEQKVSDREVDDRKLYDPTAELSRYRKPTIDLLEQHKSNVIVKEEEIRKNKDQIVSTLDTFGIKISEIEATVGPTVTLYEIRPAPGVRISKIQNLEKDIALSLAALGIRIIAPIPGKSAIGIEVPNKQKAVVSMYSVIKSQKFHDSEAELPIALGKTIQNETLVLDLAKMPHLLVAGATGQGKSVGLNAIVTSLLYKKHPSELKFILVDPKRLELTQYAALSKHFIAQMEGSDDIVLTDVEKVVYTLNSLCKEMDDRYKLLEDAQVKSLKEYNDKFIHRKLNPLKGHRYLPYLVLIIDEFADLIMTAGREIETPIARIAQLARAAGIHMIIATQRPTTNIITGTIRANFPARMAFKVMTQVDSRTILDRSGADQLIGRGDMLILHGSELTRVQCAFIDTPEVEAITQFIGSQRGYSEPYWLPEYQPETDVKDPSGTGSASGGDYDPLIVEIARYVVDNQVGSASTIQRHFSIGFNRAGRIVDQLADLGIVGRPRGSKPREVLISDPVLLENILDHIQ